MHTAILVALALAQTRARVGDLGRGLWAEPLAAAPARQEPKPDPSSGAPPPPAAPVSQEPAKTPFAYDPRYHSLEEVVALVKGWIGSAKPDQLLVEPVELPATATGLPVEALAFGGPGKVPLAERPTLLLLGGLDGVSLSGCEAVLATCSALLSQPDRLPHEIAFVAVPWASPEALAQMQSGRGGDGRDLTPLDDDGDGAVDEDGPDDLDGDGRILDMLIEDPEGPWVRAQDPRFLAAARPGDAPRYQLVREGRDDDGDGRFNEDPPGGVCFDRAFPLGWRCEHPFARGAELPLDVPACRALADLALARKTAVVLLFQGDHGGLALPGSRRDNPWPRDADAATFEIAGRLFAKATGRASPLPTPLAIARGEERPGAALDWFYAVPGALSLEVAVWGPAVEKPAETSGVGLADALFESASRPGGRSSSPPVAASDLAWARWLDNLRGGIGFVEWHPVELGDGRRALVGGWDPGSRRNPPEKSLPTALAGIPDFVTELSAALPLLELRLTETRREGEVCTIRARIANAGALPTGAWTSGRAVAGSAEPPGARLEIELPAGARLLTGDASVALGEISGGGTSREVAWIVLAAPSSVLTVRASAPWSVPIAREVKP
jgi:hypothetical protein